MRTRLHDLWDSLLSSYWFVPTLMTLGAIGLSAVTIRIDRLLPYDWARWVDWLWGGGAEGARTVLSTIGGSVVTVTGVVFSITIASLTLASQQYGPYLLRNFMRDRGNQVTLGTFLGTSVYCLLVLRLVREGVFVPDLSVFCGLLLALASIGVLIYFIHHISSAIQAENLIAAVGTELREVIGRRYPQELTEGNPGAGSGPPGGDLPPELGGEGCPVRVPRSGYLQAFDREWLVEVATTHDLTLRLLRRPGEFIIEGSPLVQVWPADRCDLVAARKLSVGIIIGANRKATQDVKYPVDQLVGIALRALSPAVNDTFTALICIEWLGTGLSRLARREIPPRHLYDRRGRLRLVAEPTTFPEVADAAFHEIRQYATLPVSLRLLETIARLAGVVRRPEDRAALRRHAELIAASRDRFAAPADRERVMERYREALEALEPPWGSRP